MSISKYYSIKNPINNKNFLLLIIGTFLSETGSVLYQTGIIWYILNSKDTHEAGLYIAYFYTCYFIPNLFLGPFSGILLDKLNRIKVLSITKLSTGIVVFLLIPFLYYDFYPILAIFVITIIRSSLGVIYAPAINSIIPNIVLPENLPRVNSFYIGNNYICAILGAFLVGLIYKYTGLIYIIQVTGILYIAFAILISAIKLTNSIHKNVRNYRYWQEFKIEVLFLKREKAIFLIILFALIINFFSNSFFEVLLPKIIKFDLLLSAYEFGFLKAVFPLGFIAGLSIFYFLPKNNTFYSKIVYTGLITLFITQFLYGIPIIPCIRNKIDSDTIFILYCTISFIKMVFDAFINVPLLTALQSRIPDKYRGRVFSLQFSVSSGIRPLGALLIGFISSFLASYIITLLLGFILLFAVIWLLATSAINNLFGIDIPKIKWFSKNIEE